MTIIPESMLAFVVKESGDNKGTVMEIPVKDPEPDFALIKVLYAGVCNTDLEILQGYMGFKGVLGHEFVGKVVKINSTDNDKVSMFLNKRVCGDINVGCAKCDTCIADFPESCSRNKNRSPNLSRNHCPQRTVLGILNKDGTMAEYLTLPIRNLHLVPSGISDKEAVFSEPLAAACRVVEQGLIQYGTAMPDKVAILGDGKLGLMIAEVLGREYGSRVGGDDHVAGNKPILFGKHESKLNLVKDSGVDCRQVSECKDDSAFNGAAKEHAGKYDVVVDATGSPAGLSLAAALCRPMGTLVLKSTCAAGKEFNAAPFVIDELHVVGSRCGPIDKALELLNLGRSPNDDGLADRSMPLDVDKYITAVFPLSRANEAISKAAERSTMKVLIKCSSD